MFLVAIDAGLPIVPVSIAGSRHVMLKGRLMTCPGHVTLTIHEPIPTSGVGRGGARELSAEVAAVVRSAVDESKIAL
jgi:1-acyl-sn-glycerol-3-phosphate acyltransferase